MTYDEVSKLSFQAGFNEGVRNVRKMECENVKFTFAFSEKNPDIDEFYISVGIKNCSNSMYGIILKEGNKDKFKEKLNKIIPELKSMVQKFHNEVELKLDSYVEDGIISMWS